MKVKFGTPLIAFLLMGVVSSLGWEWNGAGASEKKSQEYLTVSGCLQKDADSNEYSLVSKDGSRWELKNNDAKLAAHVGHSVTVAGSVMNSNLRTVKADSKEYGLMKDAPPNRMRVSKITMVGESCQR